MTHEVMGYRHTGIITKDLKKSIQFYRDILGLELIQEMTDSSEYINKITNLKNGIAKFAKLKMNDGSVLELLCYPSHPSSPHYLSIINVGICHIAIRVKSSVDTYDHLIKNKITTLSEPTLSSEGIAKVFFCLDPDEVRVEIVEMLD